MGGFPLNPGSFKEFVERNGLSPEEACGPYSDAHAEYFRFLPEALEMTPKELHEKGPDYVTARLGGKELPGFP